MSGDAVLDQGWLDGWVGRGRAPGGSGAVQVVVTGLGDGDDEPFRRSWGEMMPRGIVRGGFGAETPGTDNRRGLCAGPAAHE